MITIDTKAKTVSLSIIDELDSVDLTYYEPHKCLGNWAALNTWLAGREVSRTWLIEAIAYELQGKRRLDFLCRLFSLVAGMDKDMAWAILLDKAGLTDKVAGTRLRDARKSKTPKSAYMED